MASLRVPQTAAGNVGVLAQMKNALLHSTRRDFDRRAKEDTPWEKRVQSQKLPRGPLKI